MTELFETRPASSTGGSPPAPPACSRTSTPPACSTSSDVHVASPDRRRSAGETDERVLLAVALAVRAVRRGSVCLDLATVPARCADLDLAWPDPTPGSRRSRGSPLVEPGVRPLARRPALPRPLPPARDPGLRRPAGPHLRRRRRRSTLRALDGGARPCRRRPLQRRAARRGRGRGRAAGRPCSPAAPAPARPRPSPGCWCCSPTRPRPRPAALDRAGRADRQGRHPAPGGRARGLDAIARLSPEAREAAERVGRPRGLTLHRLLGWRPDNSTRFRHDRSNRLKYDVVVVDESSMVELTMMGRLLEAVRPESRLVLVGDPQQLTSVGAGCRAQRPGRRLRRRRRLTRRRPHRTTTAPSRTSRPSPRPSGSATPTGCSTCCARRPTEVVVRRGQRRRRDRRRPATRLRQGRARRPARPPRPRTPRRAIERPRPAPAALRPPRGTLRRTPLEPPGRALARRRDRRRRSTTSGTSAAPCW